jgi:hypothetical protein
MFDKKISIDLFSHCMRGHNVVRHTDGGKTTTSNGTALCEGCHIKPHQ